MIIRDKNTLEDIHGVILTLQADVIAKSPEFPVLPGLEELIVRIENKLKQNTNATRANWFSIALAHAKEAKVRFERGEGPASKTELQKSCEHLEAGNKAHRRKTAFIVAPDGTAHSTEDAK